jgi:ribonuclease HI
VYPDGSLFVDGGFRRVGAGAVVTRGSSHVATRKWGCGARAEVYDAEMLALASRLMAAVNYAAGQATPITWIMLALDNQLAVGQITKLGTHAMQFALVLFCRHADCFFDRGSVSVTMGWVRGHAGLAGNKAVDALAKEAALVPLSTLVVQGSMVTYKCTQAKRMIDVHWQLAWRHQKKSSTSAEDAVGGRLPMRKLKGDQRHNTKWPLGPVFSAPRRWGARVMQVALGHGWFGTYRQRFNLGDSSCPCSDPLGGGDERGEDDPDPILQTRNHLLRECPHFEDAQRAHLTNIVLDFVPSDSTLFSSRDGVSRLLGFLSATDAFGPIRGSYRPQVSARAPASGLEALAA